MLVRNTIVISIAAVVSVVCHATAQRNHYASLVAEGMRIVSAFSLKEVPPRQLYEDAMNGMAQGLDPYSNYIGKEHFATFQESLDQEFGGIGIIVEINAETKRLTVLSPVVGTPAYEAGIQSGDVIMSIGRQSTEGMLMPEAVKLMRGRPGSQARLHVKTPKDDVLQQFTVARAVIPVESVKGDGRNPNDKWNFTLTDRPGFGYIRVESFGEHTAIELTTALNFIRKKGVSGVIIDLRDNSGGLLAAAVEISDMFINAGSIVSTRGRNDVILTEHDAKAAVKIPITLPLVLLINQRSASASEIVAACLQDHKRATVIGARSWGKGTVQNVFEFENGLSALKLTTASYWRPSGVNIHRDREDTVDDVWGVSPSPEMTVPLDDEQLTAISVHRKLRDVVPRRDGQAVNRPAQPTLLEIDPQIRKAVEFLEQPNAPAEL
jgi:carboxyl-terminal processing protease